MSRILGIGEFARARRLAARFALTIAAALCLLVDRTLALDAFGQLGAIMSLLLRTFLAPFNFIQHQLFRASIALWPETPAWWSWLSLLLGLSVYALLDLIIAGSRADRTAATRPA